MPVKSMAHLLFCFVLLFCYAVLLWFALVCFDFVSLGSAVVLFLLCSAVVLFCLMVQRYGDIFIPARFAPLRCTNSRPHCTNRQPKCPIS